jgi:hypothetical protein
MASKTQASNAMIRCFCYGVEDFAPADCLLDCFFFALPVPFLVELLAALVAASDF